jgi:hypothetical protein
VQRAKPCDDAYIGDSSKIAGTDYPYWTTVDEDFPDDSDHTTVQAVWPENSVVFKLSEVADPGVDTGHTLYIRLKGMRNLTEELLPDEPLAMIESFLRKGAFNGPIVQYHGHRGLDGDTFTETLALSPSEAALIDDYSQLYLDVRVSNRAVRLFWAQLQVPDAPVPHLDLELESEARDTLYLEPNTQKIGGFPEVVELLDQDTLELEPWDPLFHQHSQFQHRPFEVLGAQTLPDHEGLVWFVPPASPEDAAAGGVCAVSGFLFPGSQMATDHMGRRVGLPFLRDPGPS